MVEKSNPALCGSFVVWYSGFFVRIRSFSISQRCAQQTEYQTLTNALCRWRDQRPSAWAEGKLEEWMFLG